MALQIWLPLTKDLRNQGLSTAAATAYGAVAIDNNGKLGKCYKIGTSTGRITVPASTMTSFTECSVAFWININSWQTNWDTVFQAGLGSSPWNSYIFGILRNQSNSLVCAISDTSSSSQGNYITPNLTLGTWYHLAFTYKSGHVCIYVNGQLHQDYSTSIVPKFSSITYVSFGQLGNATSYQCDCKMNDVRIYDHCLTPEEVKRIAQGLVLHYPLNRNGWGQENNIAASKVINRGCNNYTYNSTTNTWSMDCPTGSSTWGYGMYINDTGIKWKTGESWVVSLEVYAPKALTWNHDINNKPDVADVSPYTGNDYDDQRLYCSNGVMNSHSLKQGWNKIWFSQRAPSTYGLYNYSTNWGIVTTNESASVSIQIRNVKGEIIPVGQTVEPTPWCPNSADTTYATMGLNGTTEYDCSGFCNNGTRTGTFSWTSDTPKYCVSTEFAKGVKITSPTGMITASNPIFTCNFWVNMPTGTYTQYSDIVTFKGSAQFRMETSNTTGTQLTWFNYPIGTPNGINTNGAVSNNTWNMFTITCDGTNWKTYKNGVLATTMAISGTAWTPDGTVSLGDDGTLMKMSDFRIYATALSADDVKSLYQNCATIGPDGTIYGKIR